MRPLIIPPIFKNHFSTEGFEPSISRTQNGHVTITLRTDLQPEGLEPSAFHLQNGRSPIKLQPLRGEQDSNLRDTLYPSVFKTDALNHSAISPSLSDKSSDFILKDIPGEDGIRTHIAWRDKPASYH